ncbi:unnamed protein product [Caenorhabditis bovis]|uniref:Uncharacterized protein n=1 Tax=Caenorhabditis bovis TaxID=2654633 RepID=A0A8S1EUX3_9PELO|nr:unnamed protein product [Caenorhabditis bovis]
MAFELLLAFLPNIVLEMIHRIVFLIYAYMFKKNIANEKELHTYPINLAFFILIAVYHALLLASSVALLSAIYDLLADNITSNALLFLSMFFRELMIFLDGPFMPSLILLHAIQRYVILFADDAYHRYVTGKFLNSILGLIIALGVAYNFLHHHDLPGLSTFSIPICQTTIVFADLTDCAICYKPSFLVLLQMKVYMAMRFLCPFLAVLIYFVVFNNIRVSQQIATRKRSVEMNIMLQIAPIYCLFYIRFLTVLAYYFNGETKLMFVNTNNLCSYEREMLFFPLGYLFGNVDRINRIRTMFGGSRVQTELTPVETA